MSVIIKDKESNMSMPIYLDYSATTPVDERVAKSMAIPVVEFSREGYKIKKVFG